MFEKISKWLVSEGVFKTGNGMRIFCFPHAGGSSNIFTDWANKLQDTFEVYVIHFSDRERYSSKEISFSKLISDIVCIFTQTKLYNSNKTILI